MMKLALTLGGTDRGQSGIGVFTRAIIPRLNRALAALGGQLIVIGTPSDMRAYDDILPGVCRLVIPAICTAPGPNALFHLAGAARMAAHANASVLLLPAANRRVVFSSPIPTVAVVHDLAQLHVARKYDPLRLAYLRHLMMPALERASRVVAVSDTTRKDVARVFSWPISRVHVVPNGVDAIRFAPPTSNDARIRQARERLEIGGPYVLYLARLEYPGKNHVRLIEAFANSRMAVNHSLVLAGADWGALALIRQTIERLGLRNRIHVTGFVPDEIAPGLIAGADAVAMVGLHEGFGLPAIEALAAGRPLFVARTGALTEVTGNLAADCDPLDCQSIQAALDKALSDETFRQRALTEGPAFARRYDWDTTAESLLAICRDAAVAPQNASQRRAERPA